MRKKVLCRVLIGVLWVLAQTSPAFAQTKTISGIISDQNGIPLEKATIKVKGGKASAVSDANGQFKLTLPDGANALEVSYVGTSPFKELGFRIKGPDAQDETFYFDDILFVK